MGNNIVGNVYGKLTVIRRINRTGNNSYWLCRCDCGKEKQVRRSHLIDGDVKSCGGFGCRKRYAIHGHAGKIESSEFKIWSTMKSRCMNPNDQAYARYGGRGIKVCDRWMKFENFLNDMGTRPSKKHSIERLDNNKGYNTDNCKWGTWEEQNRNKGLNSNNTSGAKGVYLNKKTGSWYASIYHNRKHKHLGTFKTFEEAKESRENAEIKYWSNKSS